MAKLKYIDKQGQVSVRLKLSSSERINNNEVMFFSRDFSRGFMRPQPEDSSKILFTGARGIALSKFLKRNINKDHFYMMIAQLLEAYKAVMHYKLHPAKVVLDLDFIIINENTGELYLIYQPVLNSPALNKGFMTCFGQIASMAKFSDPNDRANINNFMGFAGRLPSFSVPELENFIMSASPVTYTIVPRQNFAAMPAPAQPAPAQPAPMGGRAAPPIMGGAPMSQPQMGGMPAQPQLSQSFVPGGNMGGMPAPAPQNRMNSAPQSASFLSDMGTTYADADPTPQKAPAQGVSFADNTGTTYADDSAAPAKPGPQRTNEVPEPIEEEPLKQTPKQEKAIAGQTPKRFEQSNLSVPMSLVSEENRLRPAGDLFDDLVDELPESKKEEPVKAEEVKAPEAPAEEKKDEPVKAEEVKTPEAPVEEKKEEPVKAEEVKAPEAPAEEKKEEPVKAEEVKTPEAPAEEKKEEPVKAEEVKAPEAPVEEKKEEPVKAEEVKAPEAPVEEKKEEPAKAEHPKKKHGHKVMVKAVKVKPALKKAAEEHPVIIDDEPPTTLIKESAAPAEKPAAPAKPAPSEAYAKPPIEAVNPGPPPIPFIPKRNEPTAPFGRPGYPMPGQQPFNYADQFSAEDEGTVVLSDYGRPEENDPAKLLRRNTGEIALITKNVFTLGKERARVDYCVTNNKTVSRFHATVYRRSDGYYIVDNNSTNGTFVNNARIPAQTERKLNNGDILRLSNEEFEFKEN